MYIGHNYIIYIINIINQGEPLEAEGIQMRAYHVRANVTARARATLHALTLLSASSAW
jgi:hypothetical protein